ncbi:hypothetical protein IIU_05083 [Bacillus cereus VD133]|uniref:Uncharacterized protein n=1 Tax=Bacillus cereus VD133 TaxID=1053233 RepID=A0A9W5PN36_BACCE|nr:hypothetical protein IIU_05083 [Bacillus cereus VD133]
MKLKDYLVCAYKDDIKSAYLLVEFLVYEKGVLHLDDDISKLEFYFQDRFRNKMNAYLREYEKVRARDQFRVG